MPQVQQRGRPACGATSPQGCRQRPCAVATVCGPPTVTAPSPASGAGRLVERKEHFLPPVTEWLAAVSPHASVRGRFWLGNPQAPRTADPGILLSRCLAPAPALAHYRARL